MTIRTTPWPAGTPCWVDTSVDDLAAATAFYGPVIGWTFVDSGEQFGHYTLCQHDGHAAAAITPVQPGAPGPAPWTVYLASDDAAATAERVAEHGGTVVVGPEQIPGVGVMAVAVDPTGAAFGIWQAREMVGFEIADEPGGVAWTDVRVTDVAAAKAFFTAVFGWTYRPVEGAPTDYVTVHLGPGGAAVGGLGGMTGAPEGTPSHWLTYFSVADVDAAAERLTALGGETLMPAITTPFGRMGAYADPTGVPFALHSVTG